MRYMYLNKSNKMFLSRDITYRIIIQNKLLVLHLQLPDIIISHERKSIDGIRSDV